ncbi:MAG: hypothetical protein AAF215_03250 [Cyanobacteria bacterium P01_A01_bin.123]
MIDRFSHVDGVSNKDRGTSLNRSESTSRDIQVAQQTIYDFLLVSVKTLSPSEVLAEFKQLFIHHSETLNSETLPALYIIVFANQEHEFHNTLKRACYILINNWELKREHGAIKSLIEVFSDPVLQRKTYSPTLKRLRQWLKRFIEGEDFNAIKLFAARFTEKQEEEPWTRRYTSYLLVPQYIDPQNPAEQREAARNLSRRLKDQFKFDLAMYTAHSQAPSALRSSQRYTNPTQLGEEALRMVKMIVAKRGRFSHRNLARLFLQQTRDLPYRKFKQSLIAYLLFSTNQKVFAHTLKARLLEHLAKTYREEDDLARNPSLILKTCNRVIDLLTTENKQKPSELFTLLLSQETPLTLAIVLLKLILISPKSLVYLEARLADLLRYYDQFPRAECNWVINFLEVFGVTFAIYAQNVEYNLVKANGADPDHVFVADGETLSEAELEACRIFSQAIRNPRFSETADP